MTPAACELGRIHPIMVISLFAAAQRSHRNRAMVTRERSYQIVKLDYRLFGWD